MAKANNKNSKESRFEGALEKEARELARPEADLGRKDSGLQALNSKLAKGAEREYSLHILEGITERRRAKIGRRTLDAVLRQLAEAVIVLDSDARITYVNPAFSQLLGYDLQEILGQPISILAITGQPADSQPENIIKHLKEKNVWKGEVIRRAKDGTEVQVYLSAAAVRDEQGGFAGYVGVYMDQREIKEAEKRVEALCEVIEDLSTEFDLDALGKKAVAGALILTGADMGAVSLLNKTDGMLHHHWHTGLPSEVVKKIKRPFRPDEGLTSVVMRTGHSQVIADYSRFEHALSEYLKLGVKSVLATPIRVAGKTQGALFAVSIGHTHAFNEAHIPVLEAIARQIGVAVQRQRKAEALQESEERYRAVFEEARDGIVLIDQKTGQIEDCNPEFEKQTGKTREQLKNIKIWELRPPGEVNAAKKKFLEIKEAGAGGAYDLDFQKPDGQIIPIEFLARTVTIGGAQYLQSVTRDVTDRKQFEEGRRQNSERLEKALANTIQAMATAVAKRDPYTAVHQQRVTDLAVAIAKEMGLSKDGIIGIRLGATIHDIGKIYIPAEILNRPGRLTETEFNMIKTHPRAGYDIIRGVEFSWPVTKMVLQHHERLDGSGYPDGLKDGDIVLEARILAVADVVEAMASHRPYRPSLGIDAALEEIQKNRGTHYDPDVVDACLRLIKEKTFTFEKADSNLQGRF